MSAEKPGPSETELRPGEAETRITDEAKAQEMALAEDPHRTLAKRAKEKAEQAGEEAGKEHESNQEKVTQIVGKIMALKSGQYFEVIKDGENLEGLTDEEIESIAEYMQADIKNPISKETLGGDSVDVTRCGLSPKIERRVFYGKGGNKKLEAYCTPKE